MTYRPRILRCGQAGATLIEVLTALAVSTIIATPLLAWAMASFRHQNDSETRNRETAGLAELTTYFERDVANAAFARSELQTGGAGPNCGGRSGEQVHLVLLSGDTDARRIVYATADDLSSGARPGSRVLRRNVCHEDLSGTTSADVADDLASVAAGCPEADGPGQSDACWTVRLSVKPHQGEWVSLQASRRVDSSNPGSPLPRARFTYAPLRAERGLSVSFSAETSWNPLNEAMTYAWDWGDGSATPASSNPVATHTFASFPAEGPGYPYTVTLTVTTASGSSTKSADIAVNPRRPIVSDISFATPVNRNVASTYSANLSPGDSPSLQCKWDWGDGTHTGPVACAAGSFSGLKTYPTIGPRLITLTVSGSAGTTTRRAVVNVENAAPVVTVLSTSPGEIRRASPMSLAGTVTSTSGSIARVEVDWGDTGTSTVTCSTGATCTFAGLSHTYAARGSRTINVVGYDDLNQPSAVVATTIFVKAKVPTAAFTFSPAAVPPAGLGAPQSLATNPTAEAVDVETFSWTLTTYPDLVSTISSTQRAPTFSSAGVGRYNLTLTVKGLDDVAPVTSTQQVLLTGTPAAPGAPSKVASGCCDTWGEVKFAAVPGADSYEVRFDGFFLGGCVTDHSQVTSVVAPASAGTYTARVTAPGLCLGSKYDVSVRARVNEGAWSAWSPTTRFTL